MDSQQLFDQCMSRVNISVPQEWRSGAIQCTAELRRAVELVAACRFDQTEPANCFFPQAVVTHYAIIHG